MHKKDVGKQKSAHGECMILQDMTRVTDTTHQYSISLGKEKSSLGRLMPNTDMKEQSYFLHMMKVLNILVNIHNLIMEIIVNS